MARIPSYKQQRLPSTNIGAAPLPLAGADTGAGAIGQGIASLGAGISNFANSMFRIKQDDNQSKDLIAEAKLKSFEQESKDRYNIKIANDGNQENWGKYAEEEINSFKVNSQTLNWGTERSKQQASVLSSGMIDNFSKQSQLQVIDKRAKEAIKVTGMQLIKLYGSLETGEEHDFNVVAAENSAITALRYDYSEELAKQIFEEYKVEGLKIREENLKENIFSQAIIPGMTEGWSLDTKQKGYDIINKSTLTDESKRLILNQLDSRYSGEITAQTQKGYERNEKITKDFTNKLIANNPNDVLTMRDVQIAYPTESTEDKTAYKEWQSILKGAYSGKLPEETTAKGQEAVMVVLSDASKGLQSPKGAYRELLIQRYDKQTISDKTFRWALNKIENPYSSNEIQTLDAIMKANESYAFRTWGVTVTEARLLNDKILQSANSGLIDWYDGQVKSGKEPTTKEIYQKSAEFLVTVKTTEQAKQQANTPENLRKQNTKEAYEQGVKLEFWK